MKGKFEAVLLRRLIELLTPMPCLGCEREGALLCPECLAYSTSGRPDATAEGVSVGATYDGPVKDLIWQLKFHRLQAAAETGAEIILRGLPETVDIDVVTSIPISPARYRERGYNQAALLGKAVARQLGVPYRDWLGRSTSSHQIGQDRQGRLAQVRDAFFPLRAGSGERLLLIDDVLTTGATLAEAAEVLRTAGAGRVWCAVIARHR